MRDYPRTDDVLPQFLHRAPCQSTILLLDLVPPPSLATYSHIPDPSNRELLPVCSSFRCEWEREGEGVKRSGEEAAVDVAWLNESEDLLLYLCANTIPDRPLPFRYRRGRARVDTKIDFRRCIKKLASDAAFVFFVLNEPVELVIGCTIIKQLGHFRYEWTSLPVSILATAPRNLLPELPGSRYFLQRPAKPSAEAEPQEFTKKQGSEQKQIHFDRSREFWEIPDEYQKKLNLLFALYYMLRRWWVNSSTTRRVESKNSSRSLGGFFNDEIPKAADGEPHPQLIAEAMAAFQDVNARRRAVGLDVLDSTKAQLIPEFFQDPN
ncbi:hypothetical protein F5877DRAFT_62867 [Lentinula edodes]|nr:hypothetical protein F5877DRAFT_62867 [Lentinula edodes]